MPLSPNTGETVKEWYDRIAAWAAANPSDATVLDATGLNDWESRINSGKLDADAAVLPTSDEKAAMGNAATAPTAANPFVTEADAGGGGGTDIAARAYHNANQSIATGTNTILAFNSERFDTDAIHDTTTNNSRLTCKTAGVYSIVANIRFAANGTGVRWIAIRLNGATLIAEDFAAPGTTEDVNGMTVSTLYKLAVNDYVEVLVRQASGGALNVESSANRSPEFSMVKVATG